jgi:uncharacterized membrane protein YfcA
LLFGVFLLFVAFRQLVWHVSAGTPPSGAAGVAIEALFGFAGGVLAGVLGVGGGAVFVPAIVIFGLASVGPGDDPQKIAQGVWLVVIVFTCAFGTLTNWRQDTIDVDTVRSVAPAAMLAALAASLLANSLDADVLKTLFGLVALVLGVATVYTAVRALRAAPAIQRV